MTPLHYKNISLDLLLWYRQNRKAIAQHLMPDSQQSAGRAHAADMLLQSFVYFDQTYRGVQDILRGEKPEPKGSSKRFLAMQMATALLAEMADKLQILDSPLFTAFFEEYKLNYQEYQQLVKSFFARKMDRSIRRYAGASYEVLADTRQVKLHLTKGKAINSVVVDCPMPEGVGLTLQAQFNMLRQAWHPWTEPIENALRDPKNWPVALPENRDETERVKALAVAQRLSSSLSRDDRNLLQKYPQYFNDILDGSVATRV